MQVGSGTNFSSEVVTKPLPRCGECSYRGDREDALEYADECSEGSYHTLKVAEEHLVPLPVPEPTLPPANQSLPSSDQENIPLHAMLPPLLNILIPIMEEEERPIQQCCQTTLAVRNQCAVHGKGRIFKPYRCPARMQLASVSKIIATLQDSCDQ